MNNYLKNKALINLLLIITFFVSCGQKTTPGSFQPKSETRLRINLDGKWAFRVDPQNIGEKEHWFDNSVPFDKAIFVPGAWDAQGIGKETDKVKSNYVGKGWYRRIVTIPKAWKNKQIFLYIGGVHRYADIWINGKHAIRHSGYLSDFEIHLNPFITPGSKATITIRVDSRQDWKIDALTGAFDIIDYMDINWGGIYQHVWLEGRNKSWIDDVFIKPDVSQNRIELEIMLKALADGSGKLLCDLIDPRGKIVKTAENMIKFSAGRSKIKWNISIQQPQLWSPNHPLLYSLKLSLYKNNKKIDDRQDRFGMRQLEIRGADIYLNGKKIYLHGYGDDTIYPKTLCPPAAHEEYRRRMKLIKSFGFNYVRHHSSVPLPEYFDTADEMGILVQPELPIAYERFLIKGLEHKASKQLYIDSWRAMIRRYRNHPSVFGWCMSNEMYGGFDLADTLYKIAKELDPTRPVYDTDGVPPGLERPTLDILPVQFDVHVLPVKSRTKNEIPRRSPMHPLLKPVTRRNDKYRFNRPPSKPVISHEMGNYVTYPDIEEIKNFKENIKPFWLEKARVELIKRGLLDEAPLFACNSAKLQALCHKINIEAQRMSPYTDGHALWLFQDYWTTNVGLVNTYYKIKGAGPAYYTKFIADAVLLADFPAHTFSSGDTADIPLYISDYGEADIINAQLSWKLRSVNGTETKGNLSKITVKEKGLNFLDTLSLIIPSITKAQKMNFQLILKTPEFAIKNDWDIWIFPKCNGFNLPPAIKIYQQGLDYLSDEFPQIKRLSGHSSLPIDMELLITPSISEAVLKYMQRGGKVFLTSAWPLFETEISTFKPAWWKGDSMRDANAGTVIYENPALHEFPHENWCSLQFLELIDRQYVMLLDNIQSYKNPIIRAIDTYTSSRQKAYLTEWKAGRGSLLVSSLNFSQKAIALPEVRWLLRSLVRYAAGDEFLPKTKLSLEYITKRMGFKRKHPHITKPRFKYYFYEGFWDALPDFYDLTPADSGYTTRIRLENIKQTDKINYALLIQGYFKTKKTGNYTFYCASNDGSMLIIDNIKVVDNNGSHGLLEKQGNIYLKQGIHFIEIRYFQRGGGQALKVHYKGADKKNRQILPIPMIKE